MFCDKCGQEMAPGDKYCPCCGAPNSDYHDIQKPYGGKAKNQEAKNKRLSIGYIAGVVVLCICIIAGVAFLGVQAFQLKDSLGESKSSKTSVQPKTADSQDTKNTKQTETAEEKEEKEEDSKVEIAPQPDEADSKIESDSGGKTIANGTENGTTAATTTNTDYVLPESNTRYYSQTEIDALSEHDLFIARNEIYARHGRKFDNEELKNYFASKSWYVPQYAAKEFDDFGDTKFNEYEIFNRNAIVEREKKLKGN